MEEQDTSNGATRASAKSFFIIPGVRVVFALGLLLPGGAGLNPPYKTNPRGNPPPPPTTPTLINLLLRITLHNYLINNTKQNKQIKLHHYSVFPVKNSYLFILYKQCNINYKKKKKNNTT
ncbi:hypothetical protein, partial [Enterobacter hormaechei]